MLHRLLTAHGAIAYVLELTSILVNRRARRAKTDRLDAEGMLRVLAACLSSDAKCNTARRFDIGKVVQDLKECCHAILFASLGR